ncbi:MAG TPA: hypothetical protein VF520_03705 [Thermoleophilaceae bacterium]
MPSEAPRSAARAVLLMRLAVYGTVLLLAVGVYALRASRAESSGHRVTALAGPVEDDGGVRMLARYGQVQFVEARLHTHCTDGRAGWRSTVRLSGGHGSEWAYDGRRFDTWMNGTRRDGDAIWRYAIRVRGELSSDGRSATGRARLIQVRLANGMQDVCDSGEVRFRARAGMPDGEY